MVTLDKIVKKVPPFEGDTSKTEHYSAAKQGLKLIKEAQNRLKEMIKAETGFDEMSLPEGVKKTEITVNDYKANVKSNTTTKRPPYQTAVISMENYLLGRNYIGEIEGKAITGMIKYKKRYFIAAEELRDTFKIFVAGVLVPGVNHTIKVTGPSKEYKGQSIDDIDSVDLSDVDKESIDEKILKDYIIIGNIKKNLNDYVKAYKNTIMDDTSEVVAVNEETAFEKGESISKGPNWANVAKTLVRVRPTEKKLGELDIVADPEISLAEKKRQMPYFDMAYHTANEEKRVYISLTSVYDRIKSLKEEKPIISKREKIEPVEIV